MIHQELKKEEGCKPKTSKDLNSEDIENSNVPDDRNSPTQQANTSNHQTEGSELSDQIDPDFQKTRRLTVPDIKVEVILSPTTSESDIPESINNGPLISKNTEQPGSSQDNISDIVNETVPKQGVPVVKPKECKVHNSGDPLDARAKDMERTPSERPLIRYIDCDDDIDLYAGMLGACSMGHDQGQSHGYGQGQGHGYGYGQGQGFSQGHDPGYGHSGQGFGPGHTPGRRGSIGMGQNLIGNHMNNIPPNVNTYVTTGPHGRQPPTLRISTPSQTCSPNELLDLDNKNSKGTSTTTASTNTGNPPGTPPSPQGTHSPPRTTPNKKTRFLHPAGSDPNKSPTAGSMEPNREGGWGWAVLVTASLSHAINGGLALASPVLVSHMTTAFNGTSTLQAGKLGFILFSDDILKLQSCVFLILVCFRRYFERAERYAEDSHTYRP